VAAALFNATLSSLLGVVLTPLWLGIVLGASGQTLPFGPVMMELVRLLLAPLALGQVLRPLLGGFAARHRTSLGVVDRLAILLLVYTSFCDSVQGGVWNSGLGLVAIASAVSVVLLAVALAVTWLAGRVFGFDDADRIAALFCGSKKTLASGVPMARLIFGASPTLALVLLPIMIYHPLQLVVGAWLASRLAARK
jgi:sodium/bile acid cotransporter 7